MENDDFLSGLTDFSPGNSNEDEKSNSTFSGFSKFFSFGRNNDLTEATSSKNLNEEKKDGDSFSSNPEEGRSLPYVLKRISNLIASKDGFSSSKSSSTNLKQYWMPDSFSNECYDCGEKFSTFRRRHHCRVCGQIFCSRCCNQKIPGKIMGSSGDLRVCMYCCKVVLTYLESADVTADLSADLRALQEDLQIKLGKGNYQMPSSAATNSEREDTAGKRKVSLGYQEERFVLGKAPSSSVLSDEERCQALQNSASLRNLFEEILDTVTGVPLQVVHHRFRDIPGCLEGSALVDWLIKHSKAGTRVQGLAMGQMLLEAGYLEPITEYSFVDGNSVYRVVTNLATQQPMPAERSWSLATDSESERMSEGDDENAMRQSASTYELDMNVGDRTVHIARPSTPQERPKSPSLERAARRKKPTDGLEGEAEGTVPLNPPLQTDPNDVVLKSGWHDAAPFVRPLYGEADAYHRLMSSFENHKSVLLCQLLRNAGLDESWAEIISPIAKKVAEQVRPDYRLQDEMDVRLYVQSKKLSGGAVSDIKIVSGVVCSKNVAHRGMRTSIENARILLLECAVVYQRYEDRVVSLEPVMMQEHEYLRHVVARIAYLKPDVVLVHRNVSRLAQDYLLELGITLVLNVKRRVLERVSRFTNAELVTSIDAQVAKPQLGNCKLFCLDTFTLDDGSRKTLMFFEGNNKPSLGCTILLRGSKTPELKKIKKILSLLLFCEYNWCFEKSFLMDEFAKPPSPPSVLFQDSPTGSPINKAGKYLPDREKEEYCLSEEKTKEENTVSSSGRLRSGDKMLATTDAQSNIPIPKGDIKQAKPISDQSDPLQAIWTVPVDTVSLSVAQLPSGNIFRTALDGTILSISPFLKLTVPYLESENGRQCVLRSFFPQNIFYSKQFMEEKHEKEIKTAKIATKADLPCYFLPKHEFLTSKFTDDASSNHVQTLLALYRANGGQIPIGVKTKETKKIPIEEKSVGRKDVLDAFEHQRFSVLFCSYSSHSENAPAFCVDPWVVTMFSYGPNDIPLGSFLETFCFRPMERCPSQTCHVPMQHHTRRFVHDTGAICLTINKVPKKLNAEQIWLWSYCLECKQTSPVVPMSNDTWSLSFAKYLEIRFLGDMYSRRGVEDCQHSLHHQHLQFFAKDNLVASFKYVRIRVKWEISLPPSMITTVAANNPYTPTSDELCQMSSKGHEVFSNILEHVARLDYLSEDEIQQMKQGVIKEQMNFKMRIEEIQCRLTSPSLESKKFDPGQAVLEADTGLWKIDDSITLLKRQICTHVAAWNTRFMEYRRKDDRGKRSSDGNVKVQVSPPQSEDEKYKDDDDGLVSNPDDDLVYEKFPDSGDVPDSEDNMSVTSYQDDWRTSEEALKKTTPDKIDDQQSDLKTDKKSVKTILSQILSSNKDSCPIQYPWGPQDHYMLPLGVSANIAVLESEPSSIISYALASFDYQRYIEEKKLTLGAPSSDSSSPSPNNRRKMNNTSSSVEKEHQADPANSLSHCEVTFNDNTANFSCRIYYAEEFSNFRNLIFPAGEEAYLRSLSRCVQWAARGGKSGSAFSKTKDDRFVMKQMTKLELTLFLDFVPQYLSYVSRCFEQNQPTLLGKIVGVYSVSCRNSSASTMKSNMLVMENLFYMREITHKYDLKGSVRNRLANPVTCRDPEVVYLDENLLKMTCDSPLYILPHSQAILMRAIASDTEFLAAQEVMDYSLLVGLEKSSSELVVGIIDYLRTFTWDKRLENIVKTSVIIGNQGKQPTIIQPKDYRERFIASMKRYFLPVPDRWYDFGSPPL